MTLAVAQDAAWAATAGCHSGTEERLSRQGVGYRPLVPLMIALGLETSWSWIE